MEVQFGDGSGNENYRTCSECGCDCDCEPEIFDGGEGVGIRVAFSCAEHGLHGVIGPDGQVLNRRVSSIPRTDRT